MSMTDTRLIPANQGPVQSGWYCMRQVMKNLPGVVQSGDELRQNQPSPHAIWSTCLHMKRPPHFLARSSNDRAVSTATKCQSGISQILKKRRWGGLLGVNRGSVEPPVLIEMTWNPSKASNSRPVVLVGKGIVFDTGGLSLKPTKNSMDHMKADMAGGAAVIGAMEAIARLDVPLYVIGLVPATDNRPGQDAYVPGDVLRMHSGMTVEVLNTDAEGRLILADALSYAKLYRPEIVIDLATLTGAQVVALGSQVAAVMTQQDEDASERLDAMMTVGDRTGDLLHPMPMHAHYADALKSEVADIKNIGDREAGSITAAKFLEHFVDYPWVHVDMAGPAFLKKALPYKPVGGTGFGVRLLTEFVRDHAYPKKR